MKKISLPATDISVSTIAYGMTGFDGTVEDSRGFRLVERYAEAGGNFLDTAHCYSFWVPGGDGQSERFVGRAVRALGRHRFVVATKGGHIGMPPGYPRPEAFANPDLIARDLDESLDRLGLPQVDVYYLHRDDPRVPVEEFIEACNVHIVEGRARAIAASNWSVERFRRANEYAVRKGLHPFAILQNQWSVARPEWSNLDAPGAVRNVLDQEIGTLIELGAVVAAYSSAANGYFSTNGATGKWFDSPTTRALAPIVHRIAAAKGVTPTQIALAYLLNHPVKAIPIIGTRDEAHLAEALDSVRIELDAAEFAELDLTGR